MLDEQEQMANLRELESTLLESIGQESSPEVLRRLYDLLFEVRAALKRRDVA